MYTRIYTYIHAGIYIHMHTSLSSVEEQNKYELFPCIQVVAASAANLFKAP